MIQSIRIDPIKQLDGKIAWGMWVVASDRVTIYRIAGPIEAELNQDIELIELINSDDTE